MQSTSPLAVDDIYSRLAEILELEEITPNVVLAECEFWDSLTVLSIIAMLDASFGVHMSGAEVRAMQSAGDLVAAVNRRRPP